MSTTPRPPPLPGRTLARVRAIARFDGWSVAVLSSLFALIALVARDWVGLLVCLLGLTAGVLELGGLRRLTQGNPEGLRRMIAAQLLILITVVTYALSRLSHVNPAPVVGLLSPQLRQIYQDAGIGERELTSLIGLALRVGYVAVVLLTIAFQGGLALYYYRSRNQIARDAAIAARVAGGG